MALRDQPYLPLYVQDVLTDEKLIECSAEAHGVYFRLLCILHKQETYGLLCLKQKYKQTDKQISNFALMLCKQMPFEANQIQKSLEELLAEGVLILEDDKLYQKRMLKDGELSSLRSDIGKKGGSNVTKQYGVKGYLYLMSDGYDRHKIGISVNPQNRLYRLRSDLKLPKHFEIKEAIQVNDMGLSEDIAHQFFSDIIDGEWLKSDYEVICSKFALLKAKLQAKSEAKYKANTENEIEYEIKNNIKGVQGENAILPLEPKKPKSDPDELMLSKIDITDEYKETFLKWLKYKRKRQQSYKDEDSTQLAFNQLKKLSGNDHEKALKIVEKSMANNWAGLFELKEEKLNTNKNGHRHREVSCVPGDNRGVTTID